ncbi:MAG: TIM barrel protein [Bryobacterales bacterium]|nr:TIM barrel protein [Bryobacterales bacterium]
MRHAVLTPFFGKLRDRFCEYHEPLPLAEKLRRAAGIRGVEGVEIIFPDECADAASITPALAETKLDVAAVNVNLKGERMFQRGALSSPDPGVRRRAVELLCEGKKLAAELGAERVTCAPLADGYDYPLQIDYRQAWRRMVDCVAQAGSFLPEVMLHIEHKPAEPRTRGLLDTSAKVIRLCRDAGVGNLGVTFNAGHAMYDGGCAAAAFAEVLTVERPYYIHFCDATTGWDWDLIAESHHLWQWAEFLFYLRQDGYQGWITADTFPVRQDGSEMFAANIEVTERICQWLDQLDSEAVVQALERHQARPMLKELEQWIPLPA